MTLDGLTGSRSVTRRMVKRGGIVTYGGMNRECDEGRDSACAAVGWDECNESGAGEVSRESSWKDVETTEERALTRLEWHRVSEIGSGR